jgi:hypothetical protein
MKAHYYKPHHDTNGRTYSIMFPVRDVKNDKFIYFHITRDNQRQFSTDGTALLFMLNNKPYGVIYLDHPMFYSRVPVRSLFSHEDRELLYSSIIASFDSIALNPESYFATMGQQCGLCMICGRTLTDDESKRLGYGPICRRIWHH